VLSIRGSQKDARNIELSFTSGHRNVNCLEDEKTKSHHDPRVAKSKASIASKLAIEPECETTRVLLDPKVADRTIMIS
jgi:hypothetical protein